LHPGCPAENAFQDKSKSLSLNKFSPSNPPLKKGSCEKIDLVLFGVIPAKAGIQVFQGLTN
jgi:hypothetical protein